MRAVRLLAPLALLAAPLSAQDAPPEGDYPVEEKSISELEAAMQSGETTSAAITQGYIDRIAAMNHAGPELNAVIAVLPGALEEARRRDAERAAPEETCWDMIDAGDYLDAQATLESALPAFDRTGAVFLPVVQLQGADQPPELLGALYHVDALRAYNRALAATAAWPKAPNRK